MFSLSTAAVAFLLIFLSELPDKTALAGLVLGTRYRASYVFVGVAAAFVLHVALAVGAGALLSLLPERPLSALVGLLFLGGAVLLLRQQGDEDGAEVRGPGSPSFWRVAGTGFTLILVAEFGDLTQIMTANLAAAYESPLSVAVGALLALWAVAALGILGGRALLKRVPLRLVTRIAAGVMAVLGVWSLAEAVTG